MTCHSEPRWSTETPDRKTRRKSLRKTRIVGLLEGKPRLGPETVHFDIANGCNTRCTTCWHHSPYLKPEHVPSPAWKRQKMPFSRFKAMFDDLIELGGLEAIILSGMGDPTLNPDLYKMVAYAHQHDVGVTIITNLIKADLDQLLATSGPLDLLASICGVTADVWQTFHAHPTPNGFSKIVRQLTQLKEAGFKAKHVQVINKDNVHQLVEMVRFGARFPAKRINFKLASLTHGTEQVALSEAQRTQLREVWIPQAMTEADKLGIPTDLSAFATQVTSGSHRTAPIEDTGCFMGYLYSRVTVEEELLFCCNTNVSVGHVSEETPLSTLWSSPRYDGIRKHLRAGRYFKGCHQCGKYKQNLKWSERLQGKLPKDVFLSLIGRGEESA